MEIDNNPKIKKLKTQQNEAIVTMGEDVVIVEQRQEYLIKDSIFSMKFYKSILPEERLEGTLEGQKEEYPSTNIISHYNGLKIQSIKYRQ